MLFQDQALKRPGYRLSWMTVPDNAIKTAQEASLVEENQELVRKTEDEALKKQFKNGQADLEKELGF